MDWRGLWEAKAIQPLKEVDTIHYECLNLFGAGKSLLQKSGLVRYCGHSFEANKHEDNFEEYWQHNFDAEFGRYMAWVWFSVGAENLVKAALVCNGLIEGKPQALGYPVFSRDGDRTNWIDEVVRCQQRPKGGYGMLGAIWRVKLDKLSNRRGLAETEGKELKAAYKYLTEAIRNRDAHSYIENKRRRTSLPSKASSYRRLTHWSSYGGQWATSRQLQMPDFKVSHGSILPTLSLSPSLASATGCRRATSFPLGPGSHSRRGVPGTNWIPIDQTTYDSCRDPRDYRPSNQ